MPRRPPATPTTSVPAYDPPRLNASRTLTPTVTRDAPAAAAIAAAADPSVLRAGLLYGTAAYVLWGFLPMYFKLLGRVQVPPLAIVAHRVVWSVLFLAVLVTAQRKWPDLWSCLRRRRAVLALLCS